MKTCATDKKGLDELKKAIYNVCSGKTKCFMVERNFEGVDILSEKNYKQNIEKLSQIGNKISSDCVKYEKSELNACTRKLDKILTSKTTGIPIMLAMLGILFWITVVGANYPSEWLSNLFGFIKTQKTIIPINNADTSSELLSVNAVPAKNMSSNAIIVGNRPLHGIKLFVRIAISRSFGDSMILQPVTPQALQPRPIAIARLCFP